MYIRCAECHAAAWLETLAPGESDPSVTCKSCGREMILLTAGELGVTSEEQQERALQFASFHQIDLPSSYSVLLGLMPLAAAQAAREQRVRRGGAITDEREDATGALAPLGPVTVAPADGDGLTRAEKRQLATRLARRHGLPMRLAQLVADNKLSLHGAVSRIRGSDDDPKQASRPATPAQKRMILALGLACVLAIGVHATGVWNQTAQSRRAAQINAERATAAKAAEAATRQVEPVSEASLAQISRDEQGRILEVRGPNPRVVLIGYCAAQAEEQSLAPVELTNSVPPSASQRLGIFRDQSEVDAMLAIVIRRDRETHWWFAGNGVEPILPIEAPDLPPGATRFAVLTP